MTSREILNAKNQTIEALRKENEALKAQVVLGFYENEVPEYVQGDSPNVTALHQPVSADEINFLVECLGKQQQALQDISEGNLPQGHPAYKHLGEGEDASLFTAKVLEWCQKRAKVALGEEDPNDVLRLPANQ